jgi:hypothetical protein
MVNRRAVPAALGVVVASTVGALLWLSRESDPPRATAVRAPEARADLDGGFWFDGLRPGLWSVMASAGIESALLPAVLVRAGERTEIALELRAAGYLLVEHATRAGQEIQFEVWTNGSRCYGDTLARAGEPGRTRLTLPPAVYTVRLFGGGRELLQRDVAVAEGQTTEVRRP